MDNELEYDFTSIDYATKEVIPLNETLTPDGYKPCSINIQLREVETVDVEVTV